jgi:hypothetical protein
MSMNGISRFSSLQFALSIRSLRPDAPIVSIRQMMSTAARDSTDCHAAFSLFPGRRRVFVEGRSCEAAVKLIPETQVAELAEVARQRRWAVTFLLLGWWHLAAFFACWSLTNIAHYNDSPGYLAIWVTEFLGMGLLFRLVGGARSQPVGPLEAIVQRIWLAYFVLAFNLGSLNTLRGHAMFEFFPAIATLASFAFIMMTVLVDGRFFLAVLVMFASGLLMAASFLNAFGIFAVAWWIVLEGIGGYLLLAERSSTHFFGGAGGSAKISAPTATSAPSAGTSS